MRQYFVKNKTFWFSIFLFICLAGSATIVQSAPSQSLASRLKGYILLQVEDNGEAWYVIPAEQKKVYMKDGAVAYQIMRTVSLGITDSNLAKIPVGIESRFNDIDADADGLSDKLEEGLGTNPNNSDTDGDSFLDGNEIKSNYNPLNKNKLVYDNALINRLKGYILLQTEKQGQAWYVNPKDGKRYYMKDGEAAYQIMRFLSLGITNKDLNLIPQSSKTFNTDTSGNSSNQGNQSNNNNNNSTSTTPGNNQGGNSGGGGGGGGGGSNPPTPNNDQDNDGYKINGSGALDCNDNNPSINPGATDICGNNIDEDCSGADLQCVVPDYDIDNDGYDATQYGGTDCNDNNADVNPGKTEVARNNVDDNCNGQTDEIVIIPGADTQAPTIPTNLAGTTSGTQVILTWAQSTDNIGVYQYDIERQVSAITGYQNIASVNATTYTNIGLTPNGTYTYRVKARDVAGNSSLYSNSFTITTNPEPDASAPSVPTNLAGTATTNQITLTWSPSTDNVGVVQYHVEMSTSTANFAQIAIVSNTSYTNINLNPSTTYYYRVRARDAALWYSPFSQVFSITTSAVVTPPSGSLNITGVSGTMSQGQTVTITGSGFGTKNRQQALMFDNLVQTVGYQGYLQNNTIVPTRGCAFGSTTCEANPQPTNQSLPWYNHWYGGTPRFYIGSSSRFPGHPAYRATNLQDDFSRTGSFARDFAVNTAEGWTNLDWWVRSNLEFGQGPGGVVSGKILRLFHNPNVVDQVVVADISGAQLVTEMHGCGYDSSIPNYFTDFSIGQWFHVQVLTHISPSEDKTFVLVDGELVASSTDVCDNDGIYDYIRMIGLDPSFPEYLDPSLEFLWGDIYFDDSLARVIIANSSTYNTLGNNSAVHYEVQNIQSWSNNSVTFKANPGSFTSGQTAYLYVVDSNGNVNSNGYPITIAGTSVADQTAPTNPTNLSATVSGTQASLSWTGSTDAVGVVGYQIWRSTTNGGPYTTQVATSNTNSYTHTLAAGTYYYIVKAYDAAGNVSGNSNQVTINITSQADGTAPTNPTNLSATVSGTQASLSWTGSTDAVGVVGYQIWRSTTNGGPYTTQVATSNTNSYTHTLAAGTYYYIVKAYDAAGNVSGNSNQVTINITSNVTTTNLIQNSWDFSSTAWDGDVLGWSPKSNFVFTAGQIDPFGTSKAFNIALANSSRGWQQRDSSPDLILNHDVVTASIYVKYGNTPNLIFGITQTDVDSSVGEFEQTFVFNTGGVPVWSSGNTHPQDGYTVTSVGNGWYRLALTYNLNARGIKGHPFSFRITPAGSSSTAGAYTYVAAAQLESGASATAYVETPSGTADATPPTNPTNLSATVSGTQASLSWTGSTDAVGVVGYQIWRSTTNGGPYTTQVATSNTNSYTHTLAAGTYYYIVKAYDATGNVSGNSNQVTINITSQADGTAPTAPSNLTASASGTQISLNWTAAYDAVGVSQYLIETSSGGNYSQVGTTNSTSYTVSGLNASTAYSSRVRAQDAAGNMSPYSNVATATTGGTPVSSSVSISGVSGTLSQGQTITISGSGFGTKTQANPVIWDNFEAGTLNTTLRSKNPVIGPGWSIGGVDPSLGSLYDPTYNSTSARGGASQKHVLFDFNNPDSPYSKWLQYYQNTEEAYFTFWWRYDKTSTYWSRNIKPWMEFGPVIGTCPEIYSGFGPPPNDGYYRPQTNDCSSSSDFRVPTGALAGNPQDYDNQIDDINGHWVRFDVYLKHGTPGVANGIFQSWIHNPDAGVMSHNFDGQNVTTRDFNNPWFQYWLLGAYFSYDARDNSGQPVTNAYSSAQFRGDDMYFDTTQARVEIGNTATWSTNTHREIQVASTWSNGSINISLNRGSFASGQTVYLYVVDSNGNVNSNGYPIQIASVLGDSITSCNTPDQDTINWTQIPNGTLVRGCGSAIYVIQNNKRIHITSLDVLRNQYPGQRIYNVNNDLLESYPL